MCEFLLTKAAGLCVFEWLCFIIVFVSVAWGVKQGIFKTLASFIAKLLALLVGYIVASNVGNKVYEACGIREIVKGVMESELESYDFSTIDVLNIAEEIPKLLAQFPVLDRFTTGIDFTQWDILASLKTEDLSTIVDTLYLTIEPNVISVILAITFAVVSLILMCIFSGIAITIVNTLKTTTLISATDALAGAIVGIFMGLINVLICLFVVYALGVLVDESWLLLFDKSVVFKGVIGLCESIIGAL